MVFEGAEYFSCGPVCVVAGNFLRAQIIGEMSRSIKGIDFSEGLILCYILEDGVAHHMLMRIIYGELVKIWAFF